MKRRYTLALCFILTAAAWAQHTHRPDELRHPATDRIIHPYLQERMISVNEREMIRVVARLRDRVDIRALDAALKERKATRAERNYAVVTALQQKAAATQGPLFAYLTEQEHAGRILNVESYWIENQIALTAPSSFIIELAAHPDIETLFLEPEVMFDEPLDVSESPMRVNSAERGLGVINAPLLWKAGIAGQGRLVMNIDTGVNGNHVALATRWRGTLPGVQPQHAWYNGAGGNFPVDSHSPGHGTHTMGTMTGLNAGANDTIGVAPAAYWIAATDPYAGAFQWAVNPDGNPLTVDDVPDVINCSWFTQGDLCTGGLSYWSLMDNVEAAGAAVIWSAGNCGPGGSQNSCTGGATPGPYMTITPPKNRITTEVNAFAVGAVDGASSTLLIASFSSRGPSACDTTIKKPEVCAPGVSVRSTYANGGFGLLSGTSMAAPHVSGTVALMRQVNPDATVDAIKYALLNTARDLGPVGEDNTYGRGIIDAFAAAEEISPFRLVGTVRNVSNQQPLENVRVEIVETGQRRQTTSSGQYQFKPLRNPVTVRASLFGYADTTMILTLTRNGIDTLDISLRSHPTVAVSGTIADSITAQGVRAHVRFFASGDPSGGPTYTTTSQAGGSYILNVMPETYRVEVLPQTPYPDVVGKTNVIVTGGGLTLNFGLNTAQVLIVADDGGARFDSMYQHSFDRQNLRRRTFSIADSGRTPDADLAAFPQRPLLVWFTAADTTNALTTAERSTIINHLRGGGRLILSGQNIAEFSAAGDTLVQRYLGVQFNGNSASITLRGFAGDVIGNGINYLIAGGPAPQTSKDILSLVPGSFGSTSPTLYYAVGSDSSQYAGIRVAGPNNSWAATYFGFGLEGFSPARQDTFIVRSIRFFSDHPTDVRTTAATVPLDFVLEQNYPNPFNPVTQIHYGLPERSKVKLTIYNLVGQEVKRLVHDLQEPGYYGAQWDGTSSAGAQVSSGVYLYKLEAFSVSGGVAPFINVKKMLLIK